MTIPKLYALCQEPDEPNKWYIETTQYLIIIYKPDTYYCYNIVYKPCEETVYYSFAHAEIFQSLEAARKKALKRLFELSRKRLKDDIDKFINQSVIPAFKKMIATVDVEKPKCLFKQFEEKWTKKGK